MDLKNCNLCPRECGVNREKSKGFCGMDGKIHAAKAYLHKWEEPCISGSDENRGSGTIFFSGCQLKCPFCQNFEISHEGKGIVISEQRLSEIFLELQQKGAYNINLVSPTPYVLQIISALKLCKNSLNIPIAMNSGGYESVDTINLIKDYVDIFMPDIKFFSSELSKKYLKAEDYFEKAVKSLEKMFEITGKPEYYDNGILKKGIIIRHLVMPNCYKDSVEILDRLYDKFGNDSFILSLMSQYIPCYKAVYKPEYKSINRKTTTFEYEKVTDHAANLGFTGYVQQKSSASDDFIPKWDFEGLV